MPSLTNELSGSASQGGGLLDNAYFQNVASEFIALLIIVVGGYLIHRFWGRRRLLRFFGIQKSKRIVLYLSNLQIVAGGSLGTGGVARNYSGPALAVDEAAIASAYQRLFNLLIPGMDNLPGVLRWIFLSDVETVIGPSPRDLAQIERIGSIIAFGSPGYNSVSSWVESDLHSAGTFQQNNSAVVISNVPAFTNISAAFLSHCPTN